MQTRYLFLLPALLLIGYTLSFAEEEDHLDISGMEKRISALEALLSKKENATQIKAPFEIVDEQGNPIMKVTKSGNSTILLLKPQGEGHSVALATGDLDSRIIVNYDGNHAILRADGDGSSVSIQNADVSATLGSGVDGRDGLMISTPGIAAASPENAGATPETPAGGQMMAEISTQTGKKLALRLYDDKGKVVVSAGSNPAAAGAGTVRVANIKGENVAFMGTTPEGEKGAVGVAKGGKDVAAMFSEPRMIAVYSDSGAPLATMGKSDKSEGGNLTARSPTGDGVFSAGFNSVEGGGDACVYRAKKKSDFCLGIGVPGMGAIGR